MRLISEAEPPEEKPHDSAWVLRPTAHCDITGGVALTRRPRQRHFPQPWPPSPPGRQPRPGPCSCGPFCCSCPRPGTHTSVCGHLPGGLDDSPSGVGCDPALLPPSILPGARGTKGQLLLSFRACLTLCDPMDCSPPGSSVPGILQPRILEWVAISFSRGSSQSRDQS